MTNHLKPSDGIDLEQDLDGSSVRKLCAIGKRKTFAPNEHLYRQGDPAEFAYVLLSGSVKATSTHAHGFDTLIKIHRSGSLLGLSALRPNGLRDANGTALDEVQTSCIANKDLIRFLESDAKLGIVIVRLLLKRQQQLHARIRSILGNSVEQRLANVLLELSAQIQQSPKNEYAAEISITHEDLASLVISRRQYVTEILSNFTSRGLIATARKRIRVIDQEGLGRIADA